MSGLTTLRSVRQSRLLLVLAGLATVLALAAPGAASAADKVTTYKDENGWKLQVNGRDFFVKGVVWGYTPVDQNYNYNLWGQSDEYIRNVLDYDFGLLKAAGVNAIRSFNIMPPKWITYVYEKHGIMTVINPLMGRYGYTVGGKYIQFTDYSDPLTRATLKKDTLEIVNTYKNVSGVLMFAFGNESNYGLSWKSFEIENLPEGERDTAKARFLYTLFNEVVAEGKKIAPNHPFTFVNGDLQYLDLIAEVCPDIDLLGVNAYRGKNFTDLWKNTAEKLGKPVLFFEFGSDAFNSRTNAEDQLAQAELLKTQWQEMYNKSYGNGEEGNALGGFVFEWRDEWWKYLQEERLDIQDTNASWANGGYTQDFVAGQNNMNEEWWGITALGPVDSNGVTTVRTRMAYDVLTEIWRIDPYQFKKAAINQAVADINMDYYALKSEVRELQSETRKKRMFGLTGGSLKAEIAMKASEADLDELGDAGDEFTDGQMVFVDFGFNPTSKIEGQFTVNLLGNVADLEPLEIQYGRRGAAVDVTLDDTGPERDINLGTAVTLEDRERIEIYDFNATYQGTLADVEVFYHTPRYHWKYEGDFFGLIREATDIEGEDIWNAKAPEGIEFTGKGSFDGLKFVVGPEVYWGANPKAVLKYSSTFNKTLPFLGGSRLGQTQYTVILSEDFDRLGESASATAATVRESRQATLYTRTDITDRIRLELGGIISATERRGDVYDRVENDDEIVLDEIDTDDTLGVKAKLSFPVFGALGYVATHHAGLVAEGGDPLQEFGTRLPYDDLGNKREYEAGLMMNFGNWMVFPRYLYRENLVDANPFIAPEIVAGELVPGTNPRDRDSDPFAVLGNREARAAELFVTYDPTGATNFYQWDNDMREDAAFAFNLGGNYTEYPTATDSYQFFFAPAETNAAFGVGLPPEDVWEVSSRMVFNPSVSTRIVTNLVRGFQQSTGDPNGGTRKFWEFDAKLVVGGRHVISGYFKKDAFGPYDFHRQFNITFPEQYKLDYAYLLDSGKTEGRSSKIGLRILHRTLDENSPGDEFIEGENDYLSQAVLYYILNFGGTSPPAPRN
jgi:beta-galactosidase